MGDGSPPEPSRASSHPSPAVAASAEAEAIEVLGAEDGLPMAAEDNDRVGRNQSSASPTCCPKAKLPNHQPLTEQPLLSRIQCDTSRGQKHTRKHWKALFDQMSNKRSNSFRQAILQGNRRLCSKALLEETGLSLSQRLIRHVAYETLPREIDRKWYYDSYTCCPPPWFMIAITIVEVAFFLYNGVVLDRFVLQVTHPLYLKNSLLYHPQLRAQAWRYLTYIFMHAGIEHLGLNVVLQLVVGVPLEMVHGAARIGFVYIAGVLAGSLAVSIADMTAPVVGSSGGVYALVSAHLANIVMNWSGMKCQFKLLRVAVALICMSFEFGRAVWLRFYPSAYPPCPHPSFVAHLGGVAVGITLGVVILRNYEQRLQDQSLWWIFSSMYVVFVLFAIFWNIFAYSLLDLKLPPPP
ncbi:rhomboid-related protein 3 isoform X4 [Anolis carolinensis]|uniref:rhomboid-related protein 3 isoform X4 n=1 Tax=Anolis carolinensis TaxID=28377 RepID=UPI002F2B18A6